LCCVPSVVHFLKSPQFTHVTSFVERFRVALLEHGHSVERGD
jgi:hypothetical protein